MKTLTSQQKEILTTHCYEFFSTVIGKVVYKNSDGAYEFCLNDNPLTDMNAANALERMLEQFHLPITRERYMDALLRLVIDHPDASPDEIDYDTRWRIMTATAEQKFEAFFLIFFSELFNENPSKSL
jgi:hypothetical protein